MPAFVKAILQQVTQAQAKPNPSEDEIIQRKSASMLQQIERHNQKMGKSVNSPYNLPKLSEQELVEVKTRLLELKKGMSLGELSICEAREQGRRY